MGPPVQETKKTLAVCELVRVPVAAADNDTILVLGELANCGDAAIIFCFYIYLILASKVNFGTIEVRDFLTLAHFHLQEST